MKKAQVTPSMKISPADVNRMSQEDFVRTVGGVFEHSPWIAEAAWWKRPFKSGTDLHEMMCLLVQQASAAEQETLIQAHPDLAGRLAQLGHLTSESTNEQRAAGLGALTQEEKAAFEEANQAYREKFGFPFVICARLSNKQVILDAMALRVNNDRATEIKTALAEIYKIAQLRLEDII